MAGGGIDFLLERAVDAQELRAVLTRVLGVRDVEVVDDVADLQGGRPAYAALYGTTGDFRAHVSLDPLGDRDTVRAVARELGTGALVPDEDSDSPYAYIHVTPDGEETPVLIQALDDEDEIRLYKP